MIYGSVLIMNTDITIFIASLAVDQQRITAALLFPSITYAQSHIFVKQKLSSKQQGLTQPFLQVPLIPSHAQNVKIAFKNCVWLTTLDRALPDFPPKHSENTKK